MVVRLAAVLLFAAVLAPHRAGAQTSTLAPFGWSATVTLGTSAGRRPVTDARVILDFTNRLVPAQTRAFYGPETATPDPNDARLSAQLARDIGGSLAHYEVEGEGSRAPEFSIDDGVRTLALLVPGFEAPATGDLHVNIAKEDLCSITFPVEAAGAHVFGGLFVTFAAVMDPTMASFGAGGRPLPGTDPVGRPGYVQVVQAGKPVAIAELLVPRGNAYGVRGTLIIDTVPVDFALDDAVVVNDACQVVTKSGASAGAKLNGVVTGQLDGSLWLAADPLGGADAPVLKSYVMQVSDAVFTANSQVVNLPAAADAPVPFQFSLKAQMWLLTPRASLAWPDGRTEDLDLPRSIADGRWLPAAPLTGPVPRLGVYPDASLVLGKGESERADFHAPMAFAKGRVVPRGCALPSDISDGAIGFTGLPIGPTTHFRAEDGTERAVFTGNDLASGRTPLVAGSGAYEFVGTPGPWRETDARIVFTRPGLATGTDLSGEVQLLFNQPPAVQLPMRRSQAPEIVHDLPLGAVTVTLRVLNADGTLRPFRQPGVRISQGDYRDATTGLGASFSAAGNAARDLAPEQHVRLVAPPGTYDIEGVADVPQNADGTGPLTRAPFPTIRAVPFRPPRADGSCDAICLDAQTGQYVGDDEKPPVLTVDPLPARTGDESVTVTGRVTDESPIDRVTVNGVAAALAGAEDGPRTFTVTVPLVEGANAITVVGMDRCGESNTAISQVFRVVNHPPRLFPIGDRTIDEGQVLSVVIGADDPDGDALTYRVEGAGLPAPGPVVDPVSGLLLWVTDFASEGTYDVTYVVSDGVNETRETATITVVHVNQPPVLLSIGGREAHGEGLAFTVQETDVVELPVVAMDGDEDPLSFMIAAADGGVERGWTLENGFISWHPTYGDAGSYPLVVTVTDDEGGRDSAEFVLIVNHRNRPPVLVAPGAKVVDEGQPLSFVIAGSDVDGDALTWTLDGDPRALPASLATKPVPEGLEVTWTPDFDAAGMWAYAVRVDDGHGGQAEAQGLISVRDVNRAPVFGPVPDQYPQGFAGSFAWTVEDPDRDPLSCEALELPPGALFDPFARTVSWPELPAEAHYHARIRCSDGALTSELDVNVVNSWGVFAGGCGCGGGSLASAAWLLGLLVRRKRR